MPPETRACFTAVEWGHAAPEAKQLLLARRVVGVGAGAVGGRVQHFLDLGDLFLDQPLDARLERDVGGAAALAAPAHLDVNLVLLDVEQLDEAAVAGDGRIDGRVDQLLHLGHQLVAHVLPPCVIEVTALLYPTFRSGPTGPWWAPLSRTRPP